MGTGGAVAIIFPNPTKSQRNYVKLQIMVFLHLTRAYEGFLWRPYNKSVRSHNIGHKGSVVAVGSRPRKALEIHCSYEFNESGIKHVGMCEAPLST